MLSVNKAENQAANIDSFEGDTPEEVGKFYADIYKTLLDEGKMSPDHARDIVVAIVTTP